MKTIIIGLAMLFLTAPAIANNEIKNELHNSGIAFMYKHYPSGDKPDQIHIFNEDDIAIVCAIDGINSVWVLKTEHKCN